MRTTVDLDEDILSVVKHLTQERQQSLGRVLSDLVRQALQPAAPVPGRRSAIPVLPRKPGAQPVTAQMVKDLLETDL
ncbi:MAG TPA: hypothetical protein VHZ07_01040 [Bryobacteraceae bacterium]|jgi:hypothetical protein|nr:hypothetical protein [Bryobacteraceae bacterium]